jgi:hypothetical protein
VDVMLADGGRDDKIRAQAQAPAHARTRGKLASARLTSLTSESKHKVTKRFSSAPQPLSHPHSPLVYSPALLLSCSCPAFVLNLPIGLHDGASSGQGFQTWQRAVASPAHRIDNNLRILRACRQSPAS